MIILVLLNGKEPQKDIIIGGIQIFLWHKTLNQKESKIEKRKICIYQYCLQNGNDFNSGFLEAPAIKSSSEAAQLRTIICENLKLNEKNYTLISLNIIGEKDE